MLDCVTGSEVSASYQTFPLPVTTSKFVWAERDAAQSSRRRCRPDLQARPIRTFWHEVNKQHWYTDESFEALEVAKG